MLFMLPLSGVYVELCQTNRCLIDRECVVVDPLDYASFSCIPQLVRLSFTHHLTPMISPIV